MNVETVSDRVTGVEGSLVIEVTFKGLCGLIWLSLNIYSHKKEDIHLCELFPFHYIAN